MRKTIVVTLIVLMLSAMALTACGGGASDGPVIGDAAKGEELYNRATLGSKSSEGCVACHNYDETQGDETDAPFTAGTATKAEGRVPGLSAEEYILESIVNPDAYVVEGYNAGDMYQSWGEDLSEQEMADIIAYLLTLK
ncbi:MAG: cytochrome c [Anaerolineae bacterium]|jgi:cytochrome c553|nr:cytochrome c [Anaerolineae bacterium]MBT7070175.1 cytochrome c [Anaerolineae bacterium]MBT7324316.1 cytochrome c [Anaerolineae bacterium]